MILLKPAPLPKIWGDRTLLDYGCEEIGEPIGEACTVCADGKCSSIVIFPEENVRFSDYYRDHSEDFGWDGAFPLTITIVSAREDLSLQVHPDEDSAKELEGLEDGKEESWVFLKAGAPIVCGTKCRKEEMRSLIEKNRWEEIYACRKIEDLDYVHVKPGTLHAISRGSLVYEIMQSNDVTYRFYDYDRRDSEGRKRELHLEKALASLHHGLQAEKMKFENGRLFEADHYRIMGEEKKKRTVLSNPEEVFDCVTILDGSLNVKGREAGKGYSIILLPKEKAEVSGEAWVMHAWPKKQSAD